MNRQLPLDNIEQLAHQASGSDQLELADIGQRVLADLAAHHKEQEIGNDGHALQLLLAAMNNEQCRVLLKKMRAGKGGWSLTDNAAYFNERMTHHHGQFRVTQDKSELVHMVNYAMFLWFVTPEKN